MTTTGDSATATSKSSAEEKQHHRVVALLLRYWWLIFAAVIAGHLIAWGVGNTETARVHWVFFTTNTSIGLVIAVAVILGAIFTVLMSQQRKRGAQAAERVRSAPSVREAAREKTGRAPS